MGIDRYLIAAALNNIEQSSKNAIIAEHLYEAFYDNPMIHVNDVDHTLEPIEQVRQMIDLLAGAARQKTEGARGGSL